MATRRLAPKASARGASERPSAEAEEERLLVEAAQRDPANFDALYEMHFECVYAYLSARVRDRATAEDLTSEVFHKALTNLSRYEWRGIPFLGWLLRIAANAIVDHARRSSRQAPMPDDPPEPTKAELRAVEDSAQLFRLVSQLPAAQKEVVNQRFVEQRSIREIAGRMKKTEGAIKQLQLRALEKLRAQMGVSRA